VTDLPTADSRSQHPDSEAIAAYLGDALEVLERSAMEAHLAECLACRREVTGARRLVRSGARAARRRVFLPLAAAALLVAGVGLAIRSPAPDASRFRASEDRSARLPGDLLALAPTDGATVEGRDLTFVWSSVPGAPLYRLTLTDAGGRGVWEWDTADTLARLPDQIALAHGAVYFWYVDAADALGGSITTGTNRLKVAP